MSQPIKSIIKTQPTVHRFAVAARALLYRYAVAVHPRKAFRGEDRLERYLLQLTNRVEHPVFVKVGANDGVTGDPCGDVFLKHTNWMGLLIEPVPYCFENLKVIYDDSSRFILDQVAVGAAFGTEPFYYVSEDAREHLPDLPGWYDQLGSFDRAHILKHLDASLEPFIISTDVRLQPLDAVLRRHRLTNVDFLHVDTEGHDLQVLKSLNFSEHTPSAILVEHKHLSPDDRVEMKDLLKGNGYDIGNAGFDFFAVHRKTNKMMQGSRRPTDD